MNQMTMFRLAALLLLLTTPLLAQSGEAEYSVVVLPPPVDPTRPPITLGAWGINDAGQIVGAALLTRFNAHIPVLWEDNTAPPIDLGGGLSSGGTRTNRAFAINERGQIVGRGTRYCRGQAPTHFSGRTARRPT